MLNTANDDEEDEKEDKEAQAERRRESRVVILCVTETVRSTLKAILLVGAGC